MIKYNSKMCYAYFLLVMFSIFTFYPTTIKAQCGKGECGEVSGTTKFIPKANIKKIWADHNYYLNDQKGMMIHIEFTIEDLKRTNCSLIVYFEFKDGTPLKDYNENYRSEDGMVSVSEEFTPGYDNTSYKDFKVFMPIDELHIANNTYDLRCDVRIFCKSLNRFVSSPKYYYFQYHSN